MDPVARRFMWRVLSSLSATRGGRTSLILTTHSMEEAEALCGRIGIMVNGGLSCLGSSTHLKNAFTQGLELEAKISQPDPRAVAALQKACGEFGWVADGQAAGRPLSAALLRTAFATLVARGQEQEQKQQRDCDQCGGAVESLSGLVCFDPQDLCDSMLRGTTGNAGSPVCCSTAVQTVCSWWATEEIAARLDSALIGAFSGGCALLERPTAMNFRYRVTGSGVALGTTFRTLEAMKEEGLVAEYSVGQPTLEQIFNQFASSQDNPEVD